MEHTSFFWSAIVRSARKWHLCILSLDSARFEKFNLARGYKSDSLRNFLCIVKRHFTFASWRHWHGVGSQILALAGSRTRSQGFIVGKAKRDDKNFQFEPGGFEFRGGIEGNKRRVWCLTKGYLEICNNNFDVAEKMEEYDAQKTAYTISKRMLEDLISGLDRAALIELMNLEPEWPLVSDVKGVHPPSLSSPLTLRIHSDDCPFLGAGTSAECCTGSVLARTGHLTVSMPCYRTDILHDNSVCAHCNELWAANDSDGFYSLKPGAMEKAADLYKPGKTGVMKKWTEMNVAKKVFDQEVSSAKDVFADSTDELDVDFPGMNFEQLCKEILNDSGVLFADAGRSKNPYRRTAAQQSNIGQYVQRMVVLWVRVKAAVKSAIFESFVSKLRGIAGRVELAAKWTVQKAFPNYPVFVGPLVCADIMLAGFQMADVRYEHQLGRVMQNSGEPRNEKPISVGPVLERFDKWAKTVKLVRRVSPAKRKPAGKASSKAAAATPMWNAASSAATPTARNLSSAFEGAGGGGKSATTESSREKEEGEKSKATAVKTPGKSVFYGVGRGFKPGVYTSWEEANAQIKHFSGCRVKKFRSRLNAEQYVKGFQAEPQVVWWVLKNSRADGAYDSKGLASCYSCLGSTMVKRHSLSAAKRFLGKTRIKVYREGAEDHGGAATESEESASAATASASTEAAKKEKQEQFFACKGSDQDGVYRTLKEVLVAVKNGGVFEVFSTEAEAAQYCKPEDATVHDTASEEVYVVWSGKQTGVMGAAECVKATAGVKGAKAEGPLPRSEAETLWRSKQQSSAAGSGSSDKSELKHVQYPSEEEWAKVVASNQTRVFACWVAEGKGRISFAWDEAVKGCRKDVSVSVFSAEDTLFLNFARAEEFLATSRSGFSIKEQLAAARKSVAKQPSKTKKKSNAVSTTTTSSGQSVGSRVGMSGVVLTREVTQIRRCFVDAAVAVKILKAPAEPEEDELERDMPAPGSATYLSGDVAEHVDAGGELTLFEYFSYKKNKMKAWPLKDYDEFLGFCRQGQRLCVASNKEVGAANAVFFTELLDIAVKTHGQMQRRGTLGPNEIRFQVRMFLHLQYATNHKVLHTGSSAMRAFEAAVDTFGAAKIPGFKKKLRGGGGDGTGRYASVGYRTVTGSKKGTAGTKPLSGCYLCKAADHYASDEKFHPKPVDGKRPPLSADTKKAILDRVENSGLSASDVVAEKARVRKYWSQQGL